MPEILIRDLDDDIIDALKSKARTKGTSFDDYLSQLITDYANSPSHGEKIQD